MAKRVTRIKLPIRDPETFLTLCEDIVEQNNELGATSPFAGDDLVNMTKYADRVTLARQKRTEALEHYAIAEAAMGHYRELVGIHKGQDIQTIGTLYNVTANIKKILLAINNVNPEALSLWGFDVVVRSAKNPGRRKKS